MTDPITVFEHYYSTLESLFSIPVIQERPEYGRPPYEPPCIALALRDLSPTAPSSFGKTAIAHIFEITIFNEDERTLLERMQLFMTDWIRNSASFADVNASFVDADRYRPTVRIDEATHGMTYIVEAIL